MRILYASDGSRHAVAAGQFLAALPLGPDDQLAVLAVAPEQRAEAADAALAPARETFSHSAASLDFQVRDGHPAEQILHAVEAHPTDLVVVGASGHSAIHRFLLGSVAERIALHAPCSVLVVRPAERPPREVIIGVDGSEGAHQAAAWFRHFPLPPEAEVRLVTVLPLVQTPGHTHVPIVPPLVAEPTTLDRVEREAAQKRLDEIAAHYADAGTKAVTELKSGDPSLGLLEVAEDQGADLLVVGSHGWGAVRRFLLGSVSQDLLRHAPCSVLIVRATGDHSMAPA